MSYFHDRVVCSGTWNVTDAPKQTINIIDSADLYDFQVRVLIGKVWLNRHHQYEDYLQTASSARN